MDHSPEGDAMPRAWSGAAAGPLFAVYDDFARVKLPGGRQLVARPLRAGGAAVWEGPSEPTASADVSELVRAERFDSVHAFDDWGGAVDYCWHRLTAATRAPRVQAG